MLDYLWLAKIMKSFYLEKLASIVEIKNNTLVVNIYGAVAFYAVAVFSIYYFVVRGSTDIYSVATRGAVLGFCMYAFYDFTNYATLKNYPLSLTLIDITWGTFLVACVSLVMFLIINR